MTPTPCTIECSQSLAEAIELMAERSIRHLPVVEHGRLIGVLSERDVYWCESMKDVDPEVMTVVEAMTPEPFVVEPDDDLEAVIRRMAADHFGSALVVDRGQLAGVFTASDALRVLADLLHTQPDRPAP
jgi:acetoin utilization protein AcuB